MAAPATTVRLGAAVAGGCVANQRTDKQTMCCKFDATARSVRKSVQPLLLRTGTRSPEEARKDRHGMPGRTGTREPAQNLLRTGTRVSAGQKPPGSRPGQARRSRPGQARTSEAWKTHPSRGSDDRVSHTLNLGARLRMRQPVPTQSAAQKRCRMKPSWVLNPRFCEFEDDFAWRSDGVIGPRGSRDFPEVFACPENALPTHAPVPPGC